MGGTGRFTSKGFAVGALTNRVRDWFDWMLPEAWNVEHNNLHHFRLGEPGDPDLVERNLETLRQMKLPMVVKYGVVAVMACVWKWFYYAPNTYKQLKIQELKRAGKEVPSDVDPHSAFALPTFFEKEASQLGYVRRLHAACRRAVHCALLHAAPPAPLLLPGLLHERAAQHAARRRALQPALVHRDRDESRR